MSKDDAPSAPDPYQAAGAQYLYGTQAANYNMGLGAINNQTPYGSSSWSVNPGGVATTGYPSGMTGTPGGVSGASGGVQAPGAPAAAPPVGANGTAYGNGGLGAQASAAAGGASSPAALAAAASAAQGGGGGVPSLTPPQYTQSSNFSPALQGIFSNNAQAAGDAGPLKLQTNPDQGAFDTALKGNLAAINPTINAQYEALDSSLRNSGNLPGSPAYQTAMGQFTANEGGMLDQAAGSAENTGINVMNAGNQAQIEQQNVPLQDLLSMGGALPSGGSPSGSVSSPDIMGAFNNQYQGQLNAYNAQTGSQNAVMGDIGSIAAMALMFSDRRLKKDIEQAGATPGGLPLYRFRYLWDLASVPRRLGVMAQDLLGLRPSAVFMDRSGYLMVDYAQVN